jgi:diguanylate cyclase (GGDEF)-like protein
MSPGYNDPSDATWGRESIFRKKLNELRTTGHLSKMPQADSQRRSRELERNALLENVSHKMAQTDKQDLERLTLLDSVTEVYNNATISRILKDEVKRAKRYRMPMSIIMVAIDGFRETNARFGPLTGDSILKGVANVIMTTIRDVDIPARFDAESFLCICPNTDVSGIGVLAERLRNKICTERVSDVGQNWSVTLSIGMGSYPMNGTTDEALVLNVGQAMRDAEIKGGNRYEVAIPAVE